jgi:hypothetical protein
MKVRPRRILLVLCAIGAGAVGLVAVSGVTAAALLGTERGNRWLTARALQAANAALEGGTLEIGAIRTNGWGEWRADDVRLVDENGKVIGRIGRLAIDLHPLDLLERRLDDPVLQADDVELELTQGADGSYDLVKILGGGGPPSTTPSKGLPIALHDARVGVNALSVILRKEGQSVPVFSASGVTGGLRLGGKGKTFVLDQVDLAGTLVQPGPSVVRLGGAVWIADGEVHAVPLQVSLPGTDVLLQGTVDGDALDLQVDARSLDLARIDPLAGSPGISGVFGGSLHAAGPWSAVHVTGALAGQGETEGQIGADALVDLASESVGYKGDLQVEDFHVERVYPAAGGRGRLERPADVRRRRHFLPG